MKKIIALTLITLGICSCADTRNHIRNDSTSWETVRYQTNQNH